MGDRQEIDYAAIVIGFLRYVVGGIFGASIAATILVVFAVVFSANMNASYSEFMSLFRGENFALNLFIGAVFGMIAVYAKLNRSRHRQVVVTSGQSGVHGGRQQAVE